MPTCPRARRWASPRACTWTAGNYVPDRITNAMVRNRLAQPDAADGFLLDGYPRTLDQVDVLDEMLADLGLKLDHVVELTVDTDEVVARLLKRAQEQGRADDTEEVIRRRMEVYAEQTEPLTRVYDGQGHPACTSTAWATIDEVRDRVLRPAPPVGTRDRCARQALADRDQGPRAAARTCAPRDSSWQAPWPTPVQLVAPGITTGELDAAAAQFIADSGARRTSRATTASPA